MRTAVGIVVLATVALAGGKEPDLSRADVSEDAKVRADTVGGRYIVRLADGAVRARLMTEVLVPGLALEVRHERLVRGLRSIHEAAYFDATGAMDAARRAGTFREIDRLWIVNAVIAELDLPARAALESDPAVAEIVPDRRLKPGISVKEVASQASPANDPSEEISFLNVPEVWSQGITGKGAIVANIDTGVNGEDETFGDRWRGFVAGSDASWYAPVSLTVVPTDEDDLFGFGHGSATMGLLTGGDETYGVAFDATWMAGDVFEGREGWVSNALKVLEWMTDPDGDPSTQSDVPDVVSNSYGLEDTDETGKVRCDPIFNEAIDALEAAGAIVIWSAGNLGEGGVTSPANRADSPVNAFAVGGIDPSGNPVPSSGRGPSRCGGPHAVKPEVVAPGQGVLTRNRFNRFTRLTGTSFATPMVGGVLALMRSKNPDITPEAAKSILLETAHDIPPTGNDNQTGFGLVDAAAALESVDRPTSPLARLVGFRPPSGDLAGKAVPAQTEGTLVLRPGGTHELQPILSNHGPAIPASMATLSSSTPGVTVTRGTISLEAVETGDFFGPANGGRFEIRLEEGMLPGSPVTLDVVVQGAAIGPFRLVMKAGEPFAGDFATHDRGEVRLSVTNFGGLGFYTGIHQSGFVLRGDGFRFPPTSSNWLFHASFLAGTGRDRISDDVPYGEDTQNASDWIPLFGFPIAVDETAGGQRIVASYDDRKAPAPLGLQVRQESFAFAEPGEDGFVILRYMVTNTTDRRLEGLRFGLFADWDLPGDASEPAETAGWASELRLGFVEGTRSGQPALGLVWLDDVPLGEITYKVLRRAEILESTLGNPTTGRSPMPAEAPLAFQGEFSDAEKWDALASGQTDTNEGEPQDLWQVIGVGPISLAAGATDTVAVALVGGETRETLEDAAGAAREAYFRRVLGREPPGPPTPTGELVLEQNFPNPFRTGESTTIRFAIPDGSAGSGGVLGVFDVAGRRVRILRRDVAPGTQAVSWDGRDAAGRSVPPGVYVIRLVADGEERTVRALVLPN